MQIGNIKEINDVKGVLSDLQNKGIIKEWSLPYENLLTRLTAAIFYVSPAPEHQVESIWKTLNQFPRFSPTINNNRELSNLEWKVEFNKDFSL